MNELFANKKLMIIGGVIIAIILAVVAYFVSRPQPKAVVTANAKVDLIWWDASGNNKAYKEIVDDFKALPGNQSVNIQIVNVDYDNGETYYQKLITDLAKNKGPDIFTIRGDELPAWKDYLSPITNVFSLTDTQVLADYKTNFTDLAVKSTVDRDKIYAVTSYSDNLALYYNKNILKQAQIPLPPASWNELNGQLNSLNKRNLNNDFDQSAISMGTGLKIKNGDVDMDSNISNFEEILPTLILQSGGQIYDTPNDRSLLGAEKNSQDLKTGNITQSTFSDSNPSLSALNFYLSFSDPNSTRYSWNNNSKSNIEAFLEGKLAYILNYTDFQKTIETRNSRLDYGVSEIPQLDQQNKKTYGKFFMQAINRQLEFPIEKNPKDVAAIAKLQKAREFLYYLSTSTAQEKFIKETGLASVYKSIIQKQLKGDERLKIFAAGNLFAENYYKPDIQRSEKLWGNLLYRIQYENMGPQQSLSKAVQEYSLSVSGGAKIGI